MSSRFWEEMMHNSRYKYEVCFLQRSDRAIVIVFQPLSSALGHEHYILSNIKGQLGYQHTAHPRRCFSTHSGHDLKELIACVFPARICLLPSSLFFTP